MWLQACVNGNRQAREHPALPLTLAQAVQTAASVQAAGAVSIHIHPRAEDGSESLDPATVSAWVTAIRQACPALTTGISSGFWILPDTAEQLAAAQAWQFRPDFVSVNWHEPHAAILAEALLDLGVGVEAGLWQMEAARQFLRWPRQAEVTRILLELPDVPEAENLAQPLLEQVAGVPCPVLLHGEGRSAWPLLRKAKLLKVQARIGLEDTLERPDGTPAGDNAELVRLALNL